MNIKRTNLRIIPMLVLVLGLIYSCSPTVKVTTDYDHAANFSEYKTFAVYDLKAQQGQVNQLNVDRVTNAIRAEMIAKGFTESANPDLRVNAVSILKNKSISKEAKTKLIPTVLELLKNEKQLAELSQNISALAKPNAANDIAIEVLKLIKR